MSSLPLLCTYHYYVSAYSSLILVRELDVNADREIDLNELERALKFLRRERRKTGQSSPRRRRSINIGGDEGESGDS